MLYREWNHFLENNKGAPAVYIAQAEREKDSLGRAYLIGCTWSTKADLRTDIQSFIKDFPKAKVNSQLKKILDNDLKDIEFERGESGHE